MFYFSLYVVLLNCMCCGFSTFDTEEGSCCEHGEHSVKSRCLWDPVRDKMRTRHLGRMGERVGNRANSPHFCFFYFFLFSDYIQKLKLPYIYFSFKI